MNRNGEQITETETEASGGSKEGVVRWVLLIGTVLAVIAVSIVWMVGSASQPEDSGEPSVSNQIQQAEDQTEARDATTPIAPDFEQKTDQPTAGDGLASGQENPNQ